jgi:hypothetical protein
MHVNPFHVDRGLAMVFNPTSQHIKQSLKLPLYFTGITSAAYISEQAGKSTKYLLNRDYSVTVEVNMEPQTITWFLIRDAEN